MSTRAGLTGRGMQAPCLASWRQCSVSRLLASVVQSAPSYSLCHSPCQWDAHACTHCPSPDRSPLGVPCTETCWHHGRMHSGSQRRRHGGAQKAQFRGNGQTARDPARRLSRWGPRGATTVCCRPSAGCLWPAFYRNGTSKRRSRAGRLQQPLHPAAATARRRRPPVLPPPLLTPAARRCPQAPARAGLQTAVPGHPRAWEPSVGPPLDSLQLGRHAAQLCRVLPQLRMLAPHADAASERPREEEVHVGAGAPGWRCLLLPCCLVACGAGLTAVDSAASSVWPPPPTPLHPRPLHCSTASGRASRSSRSGRRWWRLPSWCCPP